MKALTFERIVQSAILVVLLLSLAVVVFKINPQIQSDRHAISLQNMQLERIEVALHKAHVIVKQTVRQVKKIPGVVVETKQPEVQTTTSTPQKQSVAPHLPPRGSQKPPKSTHHNVAPEPPSTFVPPPAAVSGAVPVTTPESEEAPGPPQPIRETLCAVKPLPFCS